MVPYPEYVPHWCHTVWTASTRCIARITLIRMRTSLLPTLLLSTFILADSCSIPFPIIYTGFSSNGQPFNDAYNISSLGTQGGAFQVVLLRGPGDSWSTANGTFSPDFTSASISFSNGVKAHGVVTSCSRITWDADHSYWDPLPPPPPNPPQCSAITSRAPCGQSSDSADRCLSKGCCYNPDVSNTPCYYPGGNAVPITSVHVLQASHFEG